MFLGLVGKLSNDTLENECFSVKFHARFLCVKLKAIALGRLAIQFLILLCLSAQWEIMVSSGQANNFRMCESKYGMFISI